MLITGDIDNNVHPGNTYRLADALIKANKRFDFMVAARPAARLHDAPASTSTWLRADYFCRYLLGKTQEDADIVELNREQQQTERTRRVGRRQSVGGRSEAGRAGSLAV